MSEQQGLGPVNIVFQELNLGLEMNSSIQDQVFRMLVKSTKPWSRRHFIKDNAVCAVVGFAGDQVASCLTSRVYFIDRLRGVSIVNLIVAPDLESIPEFVPNSIARQTVEYFLTRLRFYKRNRIAVPVFLSALRKHMFENECLEWKRALTGRQLEINQDADEWLDRLSFDPENEKYE